MASGSAHPGESSLGAVISRRWTLVRKLGEGGMGEVYAADPVGSGTRVALKILRREFLADGDVRSRFLEESRTCMRLVHPNIVRVIECAQAEDGAPYIVMELLEGVPLGAYMQSGARISIAQATPILQSILVGLGAAHSLGVVHRDLKPENVFLKRDEAGAFVVKILDFGIAKVMEIAGGMGKRTRTGMLLGTPAYMSPEQARNASDVDQRADLWSAGVLLYEMLTGRPAFAAPTEYARLAAVLSAEPERVERVDPSLSRLAPFFERALKKNREERFASAAEMAHALAVATSSAAPSRSAPPGDPGGEPTTRGSPSNPGTSPGARPAPRDGTSPSARPAPPDGTSPSARPPSSSTPASISAGESLGLGPPKGHGRGGTLASPAAPPGAVRSGSPAVRVASSFPGSTAKGGAFWNRWGRGKAVPAGIVVILVLGALLAGFLLGWSVARTA